MYFVFVINIHASLSLSASRSVKHERLCIAQELAATSEDALHTVVVNRTGLKSTSEPMQWRSCECQRPSRSCVELWSVQCRCMFALSKNAYYAT